MEFSLKAWFLMLLWKGRKGEHVFKKKKESINIFFIIMVHYVL